MIYMENWKMIMFLGTPVMPELTSLVNTGKKHTHKLNSILFSLSNPSLCLFIYLM